jgi:hypothetical protein
MLPVPGAEFLKSAKLFSSSECLTKPGPVPRAPGVYGWYFKSLPPGVPNGRCERRDGLFLLYVGIAPKAPPANGGKASQQTLRSRIRYHFQGNAEGSTLRLTLGCLLAKKLGISLRRVGSGNRMTFTAKGERAIPKWVAKNAKVCWMEHPAPWKVEERLIQTLSLPLNVQGNNHHPFCQTLRAIRAATKENARAMPITS